MSTCITPLSTEVGVISPIVQMKHSMLRKQMTGLKSHSSSFRAPVSPKVFGLEGQCSSHSAPAVSCPLLSLAFLPCGKL